MVVEFGRLPLAHLRLLHGQGLVSIHRQAGLTPANIVADAVTLGLKEYKNY